MSYPLDVITTSVAEAVRHAGGLMFDHSLAGWLVRVVTDDKAHRRALTILGTYTQSPEQRDDALHKILSPATLVHVLPNPQRPRDIGAPKTNAYIRARPPSLVGGCPRG